MRLDPFYLIVDSADWIERLVPIGVKLVQLRMKSTDEDTLRAHIRRARTICQDHGCQLIVNDHWRLAIDEACNFIHLGQEDLAGADLRAIRKAGLKLGLSTHDEAELSTALDAKPDYIALGPVWPTILKQMKWDPQGLEKVSDWKTRIAQLPLVAIGGITAERAPAVLKAGADTAAAVTDITLNPDPETRVRQWIEVTAPWREVG